MTEKELKYIVPQEQIQAFLSSADYKSEITQSYFDDRQVTALVKQFQINLPEQIEKVSARLRREQVGSETNYILTVKGSLPEQASSDRCEDELELEEKDYEQLLKEAQAGTIKKTRYCFTIDIAAYPVQLTVDLFHCLAGKQQEWEYAMLEVEYTDDEVKEILRSEKHGLAILENAREVTEDPGFTNRQLARELPTEKP